MRPPVQKLFHFVLYVSVQLPYSGDGAAYHRAYQWGPWSAIPITCSVTCGRGLRCRVRKCLDGYGREAPDTSRCQNPEDFMSKAEMCTVCEVRAKCPTLPNWGAWSSWSSCIPKETRDKRPEERCLEGLRVRHRLCNNPPPEPPPYGVPCSGSANQTMECRHNCDDRPVFEPNDIVKQIQLRVEMDHRKGLQSFRQVRREKVGQSVRMSCATPAFKLAKKLIVTERFAPEKRGMKGSELEVRWYKNGIPLETEDDEVEANKIRKKPKRMAAGEEHELLHEQLRWESLLPSTVPRLHDFGLEFTSIREGDQGLYTCEIHYARYRWMTIFYSLTVRGVRYVSQETDPFYLHSNLGVANALSTASVWLEAAQIVWKLNGRVRLRGLISRPTRRIQLLQELNRTQGGTWQCFLVIPAAGPSSRVSTPAIRVSGTYLINEFELRVEPPQDHLWHIAQNPASIRILRNIVVTLGIMCLFLLWFLLLTIWAAKRWIRRSLTVLQRKTVVQEILDNESRLLLTCRKRAAINRERLLPFLTHEHERLTRAAAHLNERFVPSLGDEELESVENDKGHETIGSLLGRGISGVSTLLRGMGSIHLFGSEKGSIDKGHGPQKSTGEPSMTSRMGKIKGLFGGQAKVEQTTHKSVGGMKKTNIKDIPMMGEQKRPMRRGTGIVPAFKMGEENHKTTIAGN
ncbi:hypothetical protein CRM22_000415 [Opisthorchis felineus]|uniref:Ig-like domain-containing protein n=1 Tax=Opisthorchis felineus TaxID=147828 RepID=A0A4S2MF42_OPIFE|nr:hypothetical protein CRM22_000415 [Opisthorchis felineus]